LESGNSEPERKISPGAMDRQNADLPKGYHIPKKTRLASVVVVPDKREDTRAGRESGSRRNLTRRPHQRNPRNIPTKPQKIDTRYGENARENRRLVCTGTQTESDAPINAETQTVWTEKEHETKRAHRQAKPRQRTKSRRPSYQMST